jgi:chromosome segregation ATPase
VSLVAAGDDPLAQVVISKAAAPDDKRTEADAGASTLSSTDLTEETAVATINKSDLAPEVVAYIDGLEAEVDTLSSQVEKAEQDIETLKAEHEETKGLLAKSSPTDDAAQEEITKSLLAKADPAVRALIEKQQADLKRTEAIAKAEREARLEREYVAKAEALPMLAEDKAKMAGVLRAAADALTPEQNETLTTVLKAANEQIAKSNLFGTFGVGGGESTISKSVTAKVEDLRKADPSLTVEQATVKVYEQNPDLAQAAFAGEDA